MLDSLCYPLTPSCGQGIQFPETQRRICLQSSQASRVGGRIAMSSFVPFAMHLPDSLSQVSNGQSPTTEQLFFFDVGGLKPNRTKCFLPPRVHYPCAFQTSLCILLRNEYATSGIIVKHKGNVYACPRELFARLYDFAGMVELGSCAMLRIPQLMVERLEHTIRERRVRLDQIARYAWWLCTNFVPDLQIPVPIAFVVVPL